MTVYQLLLCENDIKGRFYFKMALTMYVLILIIFCVNSVASFAVNSKHQSVITAGNGNAVNDRPIIGILSQEYYGSGSNGKNFSYIAASYVKYLESGGARVIPIHIGRNNSYVEDILHQVNGILFPGGGASLTDSKFADVGKQILTYAMNANDNGIYFPIWATCLGFEFLSQQLAPNHDILSNCSASNLALPLNLTEDYTTSRLMQNLPGDVYQYLVNLSVTSNFHRRCVTPDAVTSSGLDQYIHVLSTNKDENGIVFVSTYEVKTYPFYAVQWHPEKNQFEWTTSDTHGNIPHSIEAMRISQYFANFFVEEARKNNQKFDNPKREINELIYNMDATYSGKNGSEFVQMYKFAQG